MAVPVPVPAAPISAIGGHGGFPRRLGSPGPAGTRNRTKASPFPAAGSMLAPFYCSRLGQRGAGPRQGSAQCGGCICPQGHGPVAWRYKVRLRLGSGQGTVTPVDVLSEIGLVPGGCGTEFRDLDITGYH